MKRFLLLTLYFVSVFEAASQDIANSLTDSLFQIDDPVKDNVQVAVYYFPNWGPVKSSEWSKIQKAPPRFEGHAQPKVPVWGYGNENDPKVMKQKIDAAATHGIDAFIFDWYYYDGDAQNFGAAEQWKGHKFLYKALEEGFLKADNNDQLKFSIMWCNHDLGKNIKGAVKPETFELLMDYVIAHYFKHPSYWKIDGKPYFSIYEFDTFLKTFDNDYAKAAKAIQTFRSKVKAAGFPDLHLNGVLWGLKGEELNKAISNFNLDSATSYVWIHHVPLTNFPTTEYEALAEPYFNGVEKGGLQNGLEKPASTMLIPYHINVSMGWDSSPRCNYTDDWMTTKGYPFGPVIINNTPAKFKTYLERSKKLSLMKPKNERIITINSWNEWGEGSYLEPDTVNGMNYLEAIKSVFGK